MLYDILSELRETKEMLKSMKYKVSKCAVCFGRCYIDYDAFESEGYALHYDCIEKEMRKP